jgi:hypothetical protein
LRARLKWLNAHVRSTCNAAMGHELGAVKSSSELSHLSVRRTSGRRSAPNADENLDPNT